MSQEILDQIAVIKAELAQREIDSQLEAISTEGDDRRAVQQQIAAIKAELKRRSETQTSGAQEKEEDSFGDDVLDVVGEFAAGGNQVALDTADMFTAPFRVTGEFITGRDVRSPSEVLEDITGFNTRGGYMDAGLVRDAVRAAGTATGVAPGFVGVQRGAQTAKNTALDMLGLGSTQETKIASQIAANREAAEQAARDAAVTKQPADMTDDELWKQIQMNEGRRAVELNRPFFDEYEEVIQKGVDDVAEELPPEVISPTNLSKTIEELEGVKPQRVLDVIRKNGGLRFEYTMDDLIDMDKQLTDANPRTIKGATGVRGWYDRNFLPVADMVRTHASPQVGNIYERAVETATRRADTIVESLPGIEKVAELVERSPKLKARMLDVGRKPQLMAKIRKEIAQELGEDGLRTFDKYRKIADEQNTRALKNLFKGTRDADADSMPFGDIHYFHTEKKMDKGSWKQALGRFGRADRLKPSELRTRRRKLARDMEADELATYQNPILSHLKHMTDQEQLLEISERFRLRPSLAIDSNTDDFFGEVKNQLVREGLSEDQAEFASTVMNQAHMGSKQAPPPAVRGFMDLAYAGTLAQFKSATLNLHDFFVSALNNGAINTLKSMKGTTLNEFGKTMDELGFSQQAVGEYVRGFEDAIDNPTLGNRLAKKTHGFTKGAMAVSGFRKMDQIGKGGVLRANVEKMRTAAANGKLHSEFSDLAYFDELQKIQPYLAKGMKVREMPADVAQIVEEIAFTALGKQQLISHAGRPLNYLRHPLLRPAYAMTGFAIKQQAMLREGVLNQMARGNYREAGRYAGMYLVYAGLGYAGLNQGREFLFKGDTEAKPEDFAVDALDQMAAAFTLNRLGSEYDRQQAAENPVMFLMTSFLPPGGLAEAAGQDLTQFFQWVQDPHNEDFPDKLAERVPALGDFYKYYMKDE